MKKGWLLLFCAALCLGAIGMNFHPEVLRLQVVADGDSDLQQAQKLQVKSQVVASVSPLLSGAADAGEAFALARKNTQQIEEAARSALTDSLTPCSVQVETGIFSFPEKSYDGIRYPAGLYPAVRVTLGAGEGHNWWCMLYPPLCLDDGEGPYYYSWLLRQFGLDVSWKGVSLWKQ